MSTTAYWQIDFAQPTAARLPGRFLQRDQSRGHALFDAESKSRPIRYLYGDANNLLCVAVDGDAGERAHMRQQRHGEGVFCNAEIVHNFQTAA